MHAASLWAIEIHPTMNYKYTITAREENTPCRKIKSCVSVFAINDDEHDYDYAVAQHHPFADRRMPSNAIHPRKFHNFRIHF